MPRRPTIDTQSPPRWIPASAVAFWAGVDNDARERLLPRVAGVVAVATVAGGLAIKASGTDLGTPLPPFVSTWAPDVDPQALLAAAVLATAVFAGPSLVRRPASPAGFAALAAAVSLAAGLALSSSRAGTIGWYAVFDQRFSWEAPNEYLVSLPALQYGPQFFLDHFAELAPSLSVHPAGHPPGFLLLLDAFRITTPPATGALCIGASGALAPLTYAIGRGQLGEARARVAALLVALSPDVLIFGITSADAVFAAAGTAALWGLLANPRAARLAGAAGVAVASLLSWALLALIPLAAVVRLRNGSLRAAVTLVAWCALVLIAFYAVLYTATGYDPIGTYQANEHVYRAGIAAIRPYEFWVFGSPVAFGVALGLPIAYYALRAIAAGQPIALALAVVVGVSSLLGFTKAETERIWLFLVPIAALAAASVLPPHRLRLALMLLALQALVVELLFYNVW